MRKLLLILCSAPLWSACGPQLGECKTTYTVETQTAGQQVVRDVCRGCHDSTLTGDDRNKAPKDLNWDDLALVRSHAAKMYAEAAEGAMPPKDAVGFTPLTQADKDNLRAWLACGAQALLTDF